MRFIDNTILPSDITPKGVFEGRRELIKAASAGSFGLALAPWFSREALASNPEKLAATLNPAYAVKDELSGYKTSPLITTFMNSERIRPIPLPMLVLYKRGHGRFPLKAWSKNQ